MQRLGRKTQALESFGLGLASMEKVECMHHKTDARKENDPTARSSKKNEQLSVSPQESAGSFAGTDGCAPKGSTMVNQLKTNLSLVESTQEDAILHLVEYYAETTLPTEFGIFRVAVFRERKTNKEHLAIIKGEIQGSRDLFVRIHSECLTGEVLHSLKCDCKDQLHAALALLNKEEQGMVIYLRQEGRGIGLGNKIRAYALQEQGFDTVDANRALGFGDDLRTYDVAAAILRHFEVESVRLVTNNPLKMQSLQRFGIPVSTRVPIYCLPNSHSLHYFESKTARMGHLFDRTFLETSRETLQEDQKKN